MELSNISKYRIDIMCIAAIFITLCHTSFSFSGFSGFIYNIYVKQFMQSGVDIFLLVSGLGCYFSFSKTPSVFQFYKKRFTRIIIPYFLFVLFYGIISVLLLKRDYFIYLYEYSIVSFYISGYLSSWFVGAIVVIYLLFPLVYKLSKHGSWLLLLLASMIIIIVLIPFWNCLPRNIQVVRELLLSRLPIFLVGVFIGDSIYNKKALRIGVMASLVFLIISIILFSLNSIFNESEKVLISRLLFLPISFFGTLLVSNLFNSVSIEKYRIHKAFILIGGISFELYLVFERVLFLVPIYIPRPRVLFDHLGDTEVSVLINVISILIAFISAYLLSKLSGVIKKRFFITRNRK